MEARRYRDPLPGAMFSHRHGAKFSHRHLPSAAKSSRSRLKWVMLDRFVHCKGDGEEVVAVEAVDITQSAISSTCTGIGIAASLRVAQPPAVSRLCLHWPERFITELSKVRQPFVIAAHGRSILFQAHAPFVEEISPAYYYFPMDYFVYTASGTEKSPSLRRLPPCFHGGLKDPSVDKYFQPYSIQQLRLMLSDDIGFLCRGHDELVAQLTYGGKLCMLHHESGEEVVVKWSVENLPLPCDDEQTPNLLCGSWQTDIVIPFGDCYLCWVDFYLGLLFVGVIGNRTKLPCYVPLPACLDSNRLYIDRGCPDPARRVCGLWPD